MPHLRFPRFRAARIRLLVLCCCCVLPAIGRDAGAHAADTTDWGGFRGWELTTFRLEGAPPALSGDLERGLALSGQWKLLQGRKRPPFAARTLAEDLARIRLFLAARGYPAAGPVPEAVAVSREKRQLGLVIHVNPGDPVRVGALTYAGWPDGVAVPDTTGAAILAVGDIVTDEDLATGQLGLRTYLRNRGFAKVAVRHDLRPLGRGRVGVDYTIAAGDRYRIARVAVEGCSDDLVGLAHRVIDIAPGTEYAERRLADAAMDLRLTQLFRRVELETTETAPGELLLTAHLENGRMRSWDAAIGTWSDNPWMIKSDWVDRNRFGGGVGYLLRGELATHESRFGAGLFWLGWLSPRARTQLSLDRIVEDEDAYESFEYRLALVQSFRPRGRDILNLGTAVSENRIKEKVADSTDTPEAQGRLWEFWIDRKWDRTDDPIAPSRGGWLKVSLTTSEPWLVSEVPYSAAQVDAARYLGVGRGLVFSPRVRAGIARSMKSDRDVIANRRYHAGGYNSHRGYRRRALGPRDDAGNPRGGEVVLLLSGELRFPLPWLFEGAVYVDGGNVWAEVGDVDLGTFPVAAGVALSLRSPIGPLRVGFARNIADQVAGEPRELWHFGIGYPW